MLKKLIKYDLLYGYKTFLGCTAIALLYGLLAPQIDISRWPMLMQLLVTFIPMAVPVVCVVLVIRLYASSVYGAQGYLTMTLPVKPGRVLLSKTLVAFFWFNVILGAAFFGLLMMADFNFADLFRGDTLLKALPILALIDMAMLNVLQAVYMVVGINNALSNKISPMLRVPVAVAVISIVEYAAGTLLWFLNPKSTLTEIIDGDVSRGLFMLDPHAPLPEPMGWTYANTIVNVNFLCLTLLFTILLFIGNHYLMKHKLNLE